MQGTSPDPSAGKPEWRRRLRRTLAGITGHETRSNAICKQLAGILETHEACCIAAFCALPDEPSLSELIFSQMAHRWGLPRVTGDELVFHHIDDPDQLRPGAFGIAEPSPERPVIPIDEIDVFLCPGLGFDEQGIRLGRGKGYYDRALSRAKGGALKIGVSFPEQVVARLPSDAHDIPMHLVVSGRNHRG